MQVLPQVIRLYHAEPLGTFDVERNFGQVTELSHAHAGSNTRATMSTLLEGALGLQEKEAYVFVPKGRIAQHVLFLNDTSRPWPHMWIMLHGRRFHGYQKTRRTRITQ